MSIKKMTLISSQASHYIYNPSIQDDKLQGVFQIVVMIHQNKDNITPRF